MRTYEKKFLEILQLLRGMRLSESGIGEIRFAYDVAYHAHLTQKRDDGEDYISHPVEGCLMMARDYLVRDVALYITFLLHDAGEDTYLFGDRKTMTASEFAALCALRVGRLFGPSVAESIVALTKPAVNGKPFRTKEEMMQFYLDRLSKDHKAILLKMIDRLHNLRSLPQNDLKRIAKQVDETRSKLIPIFEKGIEMAVDAHDTNSATVMIMLLKDIQKQVSELEA